MKSGRKERVRSLMNTLGGIARAIIGGLAGLAAGLVFTVICYCYGLPGWLSITGLCTGCISGATICVIYTGATEFALQVIYTVVDIILTILKIIADFISAFF